MSETFTHRPVLLNECIQALNIRPEGVYLDGTLGRAGHSREIARRLSDTFTGLKTKELEWFENPREKTLKNGQPRVRRARWLPEREVELVYLYADHTIDARDPTPAETDFFTVTRMDPWGVSTWFMCTPETAGKLAAMDFENLDIQETTIVG